MKKQFTRYEINIMIKRILVRYKVDLSSLIFSFSGRAAFFSGRFNKTTGSQMGADEIEKFHWLMRSLILEIQAE